MDEYKTLKAAAQDEFTEKRSRFIGYARPVTSEQEALDFIAEIKSRHWDAKHNVYAYCLRDGNVCRYSEHRHPGSAGRLPVVVGTPQAFLGERRPVGTVLYLGYPV